MNNLINEPIKIYNKTVKNRVVFQPMEGCDGTLDGGISELTRRRYLRFARGGSAIIWFEAVAVCHEGRANPRQLYLHEGNKDGFKNLLKDIRQTSFDTFGFYPQIIMQMTHSGRYSKPNGTPEPIVAYRNPVFEKDKENLDYQIVSDEYCEEVVSMFAKSAKLASLCGFDGIDIKCCHGYLMNEFLSAFERKGIYGGSLDNRTRLYFNCIDSVLKNINKDMYIATRLNGYDGFDYPFGFGVNADNKIDLTETNQIINKLYKKGVELINITIGNPYLIPSINRPWINGTEDGRIGVQRVVDITRELQKANPKVKIVISALSYMAENAVDFANELLESGVASFAGFGRLTFAYPDFYADYLNLGKLIKSKCCIKCGKCSELMRNGSVTGCPIRDSEIYLPLYQKFVLKKEE